MFNLGKKCGQPSALPQVDDHVASNKIIASVSDTISVAVVQTRSGEGKAALASLVACAAKFIECYWPKDETLSAQLTKVQHSKAMRLFTSKSYGEMEELSLVRAMSHYDHSPHLRMVCALAAMPEFDEEVLKDEASLSAALQLLKQLTFCFYATRHLEEAYATCDLLARLNPDYWPEALRLATIFEAVEMNEEDKSIWNSLSSLCAEAIRETSNTCEERDVAVRRLAMSHWIDKGEYEKVLEYDSDDARMFYDIWIMHAKRLKYGTNCIEKVLETLDSLSSIRAQSILARLEMSRWADWFVVERCRHKLFTTVFLPPDLYTEFADENYTMDKDNATWNEADEKLLALRMRKALSEMDDQYLYFNHLNSRVWDANIVASVVRYYYEIARPRDDDMAPHLAISTLLKTWLCKLRAMTDLEDEEVWMCLELETDELESLRMFDEFKEAKTREEAIKRYKKLAAMMDSSSVLRGSKLFAVQLERVLRVLFKETSCSSFPFEGEWQTEAIWCAEALIITWNRKDDSGWLLTKSVTEEGDVAPETKPTMMEVKIEDIEEKKAAVEVMDDETAEIEREVKAEDRAVAEEIAMISSQYQVSEALAEMEEIEEVENANEAEEEIEKVEEDAFDWGE